MAFRGELGGEGLAERKEKQWLGCKNLLKNQIESLDRHTHTHPNSIETQSRKP